MKRALIVLSLLGGTLPCLAQNQPIDHYVQSIGADFGDVFAAGPGSRDMQKLKNILPLQQSRIFAEYVAAKTPQADLIALEQDVDALRMNKQLGSSGGSSGITSLVSNVAAPALIGFGVEYGAIQQSTTGSTSTLRANLLGAAKMLLGKEQFPYCPAVDQENCQPASRWLRKFSGSASFENINRSTGTGTAIPVTSTTPTAVDLFGNGFRMVSWGARFEFNATSSSDPAFRSNFENAINDLRASQEPADLAKSIEDLFADPKIQDLYQKWQGQTIDILQGASRAEFNKKLEQQLDVLIDTLQGANADFLKKIVGLRRASESYLSKRDKLLEDIQSHRFSVEYTNLHALNQPTTSNVRFIFSHQPSAAPLLITANAALTWYNSLPSAVTTGRLRDVQAAAKLDRRLGVIPNLGNAVLTVGGYYQWMKEDALIEIGPGNAAPGSGIGLPGTAATLLGTKGNIGIVQGRLTVPLNNTIKIPLSVTWSNRTELITESDTRGQVGVTLDLDSLFR